MSFHSFLLTMYVVNEMWASSKLGAKMSPAVHDFGQELILKSNYFIHS